MSQLEGSIGISRVGVKDAIKHPTMHKTAHPPTKNYPGLNVNRANIRNILHFTGAKINKIEEIVDS